jgi:hypothetical protein
LAAGGSTIGYTMAFVSNLATGALWDTTQTAASAILPALAGGLIALVLGPRLVVSAAEVSGSAQVRR